MQSLTTDSAGSPTRGLAVFVSGLEYKDLPREVVEKAKECVLDQIGVQLIGSTLPWTKPVFEFASDFVGPAQSTIINYGLKTSAYDCAMVNATFGQSCELDDIVVKGGGHGGPATVPVALALAEVHGNSGKEIITAIVAGYEVLARISQATPARSKRGFHTQSTVGVFAAAATAGKILKLDPGLMQHAFGIAGSHCSGTSEFDRSGGEVKRFHAGLAARNGIQSALLAHYGLTGPLTILEGKKGFCRVFSDLSFDLAPITAGLGESYAIKEPWFKVHPVVYGIQSPIDGMMTLMEQHNIDVNELREIHVRINERAASHGAAIYEPADVIGAQFSLAFSLALRLLKKSNDLALYMDSSQWRDEALLRVARMVKVDPIETSREDRYSSEVSLVFRDGKTLKSYQRFPYGHPKNPASGSFLKDKFKRLAVHVLSKQQIDDLIASIDNLESLPNISSLIGLLVRKGK